jgi:hypothetical protein
MQIVDFLFYSKPLSFFDEEVRAIIIVLGYYAVLIMATAGLLIYRSGS